MEALGRFVGGLINLTVTVIAWTFWLAVSLAVIAAVIALGAAIGPMWIIVILLLLIWLK